MQHIRHLFHLLFCGWCCLNSTGAHAQHQEYFPDPDPLVQQRLEDWRDLKFGLLMHWGAYSQWGIVESWSICPEDLSWASGARKKGVAEVETFSGIRPQLQLFDPKASRPLATIHGIHPRTN